MGQRKLRIAVIGPRGVPSSYSGVERVTESLYSVLAERGHAITVYSRPEYVQGRSHVYRGMRLVRTPVLEGRSFGTVSHVVTSSLHAVVRGGYDVVHLHALAPGLVSPLFRSLSIPTVATVHGIDWQRAKWKGLGSAVLRRAERWMVRNVDEIITVSRDLEQYYIEQYGRPTRVIPNGTDVTRDGVPPDAAWLASVGLEPGRFIVSVARHVPEKRIEDLIAAFRMVDLPLQLALVGDSSHTDAYAAGLRRLAGGDPRIVFTGAQPRHRIEDLCRGAAAFVLPSELEGMPMALLQALEMGVPSIVSAIPVHCELLAAIADYDLHFPPRDAPALAERLSRLCAEPDRYRRMAMRMQAHVRRAHSWPAIAAQTESLYYELAGRGRNGSAQSSLYDRARAAAGEGI
jgi:glycosyltransferase involved in cell wall biosynthesis